MILSDSDSGVTGLGLTMDQEMTLAEWVSASSIWKGWPKIKQGCETKISIDKKNNKLILRSYHGQIGDVLI